MADPINKQLQQLIITHAVYVEKYKTYESNKMLKILEAADDDLTAQLAKNKGTIASERRLRKQLEAIKALEESYASVFYDEYKGDLKAFAGNEGGWYVERLRELTNPYVNLDFTLPSAAQIYSAAEASFLILDKGVTLDLESMINSVFGTRSQIIEQTLRQGFVLGKTNDQIVRELLGYEEAGAFFDGNMKKARTSMERIVRTSMSHLASTARDEVYSRNDDIVKGYKWVSCIDTRTSPTCINYDGRCWYYNKDYIPDNASLLPGPVKNPAHYHCRSCTVPILKSWKELGININEAPEGTRSALDGYVPQSTTYSEWFDKAGEKVQMDVLGPARYKLYKEGGEKITAFMKDGSWLSLEQLKQRGH